MIRANFNIDPGTLSSGQFAKLAAEAIWVENFRYERKEAADTQMLNHMANMLMASR